jgi:hypothetical protein
MVYDWKPGARVNADAEKVGKELESIGEEVTPAMVVKKAKSKKTELHKCFEWDDEKAAQQYRITQARHILATLVIIPDQSEEGAPRQIVRRYENVTCGENRAYVPIEHVLKKEEWREELFSEIRIGIEELERKIEAIKEFDEVFATKLGSRLRAAKELVSA